MDDSIRTLRWNDGIFKFPCGVTAEVSEPQLVKLLTMFKLTDKIDEMKNDGKMTIPKAVAFQIKSHLTYP